MALRRVFSQFPTFAARAAQNPTSFAPLCQQALPALTAAADQHRAYSSLTKAAPSEMSPTTLAMKTITEKMTYDERVHPILAPGVAGSDDNKAFSYAVLTGGRFLYAACARLVVLKFIYSMCATKDVLALASAEVDVSNIAEGATVTIKWRGKPVFIRHRTESEIAEANSVDVSELRDPQTDAERSSDPKWLIVIGVCTHLGCVPLANAGDYGGWFCPCHGSHYDVSARIRKGPAPYNLEVPEYKFLDESKVLIG